MNICLRDYYSAPGDNWDRKHVFYGLGLRYLNKTGVDEDEEEAVELYQTAAEQNDIDAQWKLGECYSNGIGIELDLDKAEYWFKKAADYIQYQFKFGLKLFHGDGVIQDEDKAVYWIRKASQYSYQALKWLDEHGYGSK